MYIKNQLLDNERQDYRTGTVEVYLKEGGGKMEAMKMKE
jgi:hypothetical protein